MRQLSSFGSVLCRWEGCFIRFLDGMLQVRGWMTLGTGGLQIPTGIRSIVIAHPEGAAHGWQPYTAQRLLGELATPLATITGLSLSPAPRSAGLLNTTYAAPIRTPLSSSICVVAPLLRTISTKRWKPRVVPF